MAELFNEQRVLGVRILGDGEGSNPTGAPDDEAYTDATGAAEGTIISLLKGIFVQLAEINAKTPGP